MDDGAIGYDRDGSWAMGDDGARIIDVWASPIKKCNMQSCRLLINDHEGINAVGAYVKSWFAKRIDTVW